MSEKWDGIDRRQPSAPGRRASDFQREKEVEEMRREIDHLKEVVEILFNAVQALTATHRKPSSVPESDAA
jgi:hypothetical protein